MAVCLGARVQSVTIEPDWDDGPERFGDAHVEWPLDRYSERELQENFVRVALAGPVAEMLYRGERWHPGGVAEWAHDWKLAWEAAGHLIALEPARLVYLEQVTIQLHQRLDRTDHWAALAAIADQLLAHDTVCGEEIDELVRQWLC